MVQETNTACNLVWLTLKDEFKELDADQNRALDGLQQEGSTNEVFVTIQSTRTVESNGSATQQSYLLTISSSQFGEFYIQGDVETDLKSSWEAGLTRAVQKYKVSCASSVTDADDGTCVSIPNESDNKVSLPIILPIRIHQHLQRLKVMDSIEEAKKLIYHWKLNPSLRLSITPSSAYLFEGKGEGERQSSQPVELVIWLLKKGVNKSAYELAMTLDIADTFSAIDMRINTQAEEFLAQSPSKQVECIVEGLSQLIVSNECIPQLSEEPNFQISKRKWIFDDTDGFHQVNFISIWSTNTFDFSVSIEKTGDFCESEHINQFLSVLPAFTLYGHIIIGLLSVWGKPLKVPVSLKSHNIQSIYQHGATFFYSTGAMDNLLKNSNGARHWKTRLEEALQNNCKLTGLPRYKGMMQAKFLRNFMEAVAEHSQTELAVPSYLSEPSILSAVKVDCQRLLGTDDKSSSQPFMLDLSSAEQLFSTSSELPEIDCLSLIGTGHPFLERIEMLC